MLSHVVIFWTHENLPNAADDLVAGAQTYLKDIPGVLHFHLGKMVPSQRPVVNQTYQVGLNIVFPDKQAEEAYQAHPRHLEFVDKVFKKLCKGVMVYDFAGPA